MNSFTSVNILLTALKLLAIKSVVWHTKNFNMGQIKPPYIHISRVIKWILISIVKYKWNLFPVRKELYQALEDATIWKPPINMDKKHSPSIYDTSSHGRMMNYTLAVYREPQRRRSIIIRGTIVVVVIVLRIWQRDALHLRLHGCGNGMLIDKCTLMWLDCETAQCDSKLRLRHCCADMWKITRCNKMFNKIQYCQVHSLTVLYTKVKPNTNFLIID